MPKRSGHPKQRAVSTLQYLRERQLIPPKGATETESTGSTGSGGRRNRSERRGISFVWIRRLGNLARARLSRRQPPLA